MRHLVLVRHVEDEGTLRRLARRRGENWAVKPQEEEGITEQGFRDATVIGRYIINNIQKPYGLEPFGGYFTSLSRRSIQSAGAMCLAGADVWQSDKRLDERNRGQIRGLLPAEHKKKFPESYRQMKDDPLRWVPPGGDAVIPHLTDNFESFYDDIGDLDSAVIVGHRDQIWAAMRHLENLSDAEMLAVDTEVIIPGYTIHYTSINPQTGQESPDLAWRFTVDPLRPQTASGWQALPNVGLSDT
jgi:broad specificity phosphatase PhoE